MQLFHVKHFGRQKNMGDGTGTSDTAFATDSYSVAQKEYKKFTV